MKRNMAEKLTASILAAVLTFGMMAPQTAMTAEAAAKSTLEKDVPCMHFWQKNPVWRQGSALAGPTALIKQDGRIMHGVK